MSENVRKKGREVAILALASGETIATAARKAGVTERTLYRWRSDDDFQREVIAARSEMFARALGCMIDGSVPAALVLRQLCLKAKSESIKLGAARCLIELGAKLRDSVELEARIAALEARAANQKK
jgi:transposase-like protein